MLTTSLFLPSYGLISGLTAGLTFTGMLHSSRFVGSSISPDEKRQESQRCKVDVVPFVYVKKPHDHGKRSQEFHPVGTPYRGGMETRGGVVPPSRTRRFTMEQDCWDSRQRSSGGSPAQKWGHLGRQCGSCVEKGDIRQQNNRIPSRFFLQIWRDGYARRRFELRRASAELSTPSRTCRFTFHQYWWDSRDQFLGGSS